jgi:hypothetical protein
MATKRITCREWCKKNNVPIESLVVNRSGDNNPYFFIEQESFEKSPFHYALRKGRMSKAVQLDDKKVIEYWLGLPFVN